MRLPGKPILMGVAVLGLLAFGGGARAQLALAPGDDAPNFVGRTYPGFLVIRPDWNSETLTLLNFWATWCIPCKQEMPELQKIHEALAPQGLRIIGVFDPWDKENVEEFLEPLGVTYEIVEAHKTVDRLWGGLAVRPTSFLIDRQGKILRRYVGARPEQIEGLREDIEALLGGRPLAPQVIPADATPAIDLDYPTEDGS